MTDEGDPPFAIHEEAHGHPARDSSAIHWW